MWTVEFHPKAEEEIDALPKSLRLKMRILINTLRVGGFECLSPKNVKNIEDGIMEFRVRGQDGIARSLYAMATGRKINILVAFVKKTEETPRRYIELAKKRRSEIQNENDSVGRN